MINKLLNIVAPHHCCGCQKTGTLLCQNCKYDITSEPFARCIRCLGPANETNVCQKCRKHYERAWCIGERTAALEKMIDSYKFGNTLDAADTLGGVLAGVMADIPLNACLVPIPTINTHIRQRGYDHTARMVGVMRRRLGCHSSSLLQRQTQTVQRGATRAKRLEQAKMAFCLYKGCQIDADTPYIIVDDVFTTGATIDAAAQILRDAGARIIWVAVATREPLD